MKREPNPECRRSHLISITSQGKEKAQKVQEIFEQLDEELCRGMHAEEIESLLKALKNCGEIWNRQRHPGKKKKFDNKIRTGKGE